MSVNSESNLNLNSTETPKLVDAKKKSKKRSSTTLNTKLKKIKKSQDKIIKGPLNAWVSKTDNVNLADLDPTNSIKPKKQNKKESQENEKKKETKDKKEKLKKKDNEIKNNANKVDLNAEVAENSQVVSFNTLMINEIKIIAYLIFFVNSLSYFFFVFYSQCNK